MLPDIPPVGPSAMPAAEGGRHLAIAAAMAMLLPAARIHAAVVVGSSCCRHGGHVHGDVGLPAFVPGKKRNDDGQGKSTVHILSRGKICNYKQ